MADAREIGPLEILFRKGLVALHLEAPDLVVRDLSELAEAAITEAVEQERQGKGPLIPANIHVEIADKLVADERERCAKVADKFKGAKRTVNGPTSNLIASTISRTGERIAAAIRSQP